MRKIDAFLDFLHVHPDWEEFLTSAPYNLKIQKEGEFVLFKYDQINSDLSNDFVQVCRGLILFHPDERTWKIACHPFDKFFNFGEPNAAKIDWKTAIISEKEDGSLMKVWWWGGKWHLSTNGSIDAFKTPANDIHSFGEIFERALHNYGFEKFEEFTDHLSKYNTYLFELCSPENRIVIPYKDYQIFFLSKRERCFDVEFPFWKTCDSVKELVDLPKLYKVNFDELIRAVEKLPWDEEGYVVCDERCHRVKVKSPAYVLAHYSRNNNCITNKRLLKIVLSGELDEFLVYAEEYKDRALEIKQKIENIKKECRAAADQLKSFTTKKEKALYIGSNYTGILKDYLYACINEKEDKFFEKLNTSYWEKVLFTKEET